MEKTFKRTLLGAAVALASTVSINAQAADLTDNVQVYGQAAVSVWYQSFAEDNKENSLDVENESRIGLRGTQEFNNFGPAVIWQIESGNVGDDGADGKLGVRDSFIGLEFDAGKFRFGRLTTPAYDIVDWPYTNPGLGNVFDWNTDIKGGAHLDRVGDHFRWDSKNYGGFTYSLSTGQGQNDTGNMFYSAAAHYTAGIFTGHLGYQTEGEAEVKVSDVAVGMGERSFYIAGIEAHLENGISLVAAYKHMESDYSKQTGALTGITNEEQNAISVTAQYVTGDWLYKVGYAMTDDLDSNNGSTSGTSDTAITARVLYMLDPSAVIYSDIRSYDFNDSNDAGDVTKLGLGIEYYF
ncbi:porin [Vibrio sp. Of7-15]|uniref:porin n=1 Tax=Vibrio sp. Of7-15 TaxID=2724879 RepID=UPI001EF3B42D|nr:porin [Vibrio sp. Of7-15]MCG7498462.1 porin [Vibrio sp. Of7-15]